MKYLTYSDINFICCNIYYGFHSLIKYLIAFFPLFSNYIQILLDNENDYH